MKYAAIRLVNGGWVVETENGEFIFTSFQKAISLVKESVSADKEQDGQE